MPRIRERIISKIGGEFKKFEARKVRNHTLKILKKDAVPKILGELGDLVQEIHLVGSRVSGKKSDIDLVVVTNKKESDFSAEEYSRLIGVEEDLTKKHKKGFEIYVCLPSEFRKNEPYISLWKRKNN